MLRINVLLIFDVFAKQMTTDLHVKIFLFEGGSDKRNITGTFAISVCNEFLPI